MNEEINKIIDSLDGCIGMFDYMITPIESNLLVSYIRELQKENKELKKQLENCYCNRTDCAGRIKDSKQHDSLVQKVENQQKEFIKWLEDEKDRLARECSNIYEDSLGHTRLVNEDKFNEVNDILQKYK